MPAKAQKPSSGKKLVIVESPAKGKTIANYLGDGFDIQASYGHIRDLPQPSELPEELKKSSVGKFAVDLDNNFEPYYVVPADKKKRVNELKAALKDADELYLATDGDREGEAIAWHLLQVLKPKVPVHRLTFPEITKEAIQRAMEELREVDIHLVDAQETRRVLDRLYGYEISPVLWRKVSRGLSAGRVQSVATRLIVERERERMAFRSASYWDLTGVFSPEAGGQSFTARLTQYDGARLATGRDFNDAGELKNRDVSVLDAETAQALATALAQADFSVRSVEHKPYTRRPAAPFTTSTLQQEAARKLRFSARTTMSVAQSLYENGHITYMRTDSVALSNQALTASRKLAAELYNPQYVPEKPRVYASKSKNAQEAHEAIRPAGDTFRTPAQLSTTLSPSELKLYDLIFKRTLASQMADAKGSTATVRLGATASMLAPSGQGEQKKDAEFSASGTVITFPGFMAAYEESKDEARDAEAGAASATAEKDARLPKLKAQDKLSARDVAPHDHETSPPPRYTEASLVKTLEDLGIGRPSTYASTISTIMDRGYVNQRGSALVPSWVAFSVVQLLEGHFQDYVDYDFTADLEGDLDRIARGEATGPAWLNQFYYGPDGPADGSQADGSQSGTQAQSGTGASTEQNPGAGQGLLPIVNNLGEIDPRAVNSIPVTDTITLRVGKFGPYLERPGEGEEPERANVPEDLAPDELTPAKAEELFSTAAPEERALGTDPETGREIVAKNGRFGPYVTEIIPEPTEEELAARPVEYYKNGKPKPPKKPQKVKPRTGSLFKSMSVETVSLEQALQLMSLPRIVGTDAEGVEITAQNGRFGPYLKKGTDSRSLNTEEEIFSTTLEQALEIYSQPKQRGARTAAPPLAEFGEDPVSGKKVVVKDGRFGPYITDGTTNVTVPRAVPLEELTEERAIELLAEKRAKGPVKRKGSTRKSSTRKRK